MENHGDQDPPRRKKLPHDAPWWIPDDSVWFITVNCNPPGKAQLCDRDGTDRKAESVLKSARFYHEMNPRRWFLHLFLLMPDHLHALLSFPEPGDMKSTVASWKGYVRKTIGITWQSDFFDHRLRSEESKAETWGYILRNPVRKGLCEKPEDWPYAIAFDSRTGDEIPGRLR